MIALIIILVIWLGVAMSLFLPDVMRPASERKQDKIQCKWYEVLVFSLLWFIWLPVLYIVSWVLRYYNPKPKV
jgi:hypothetical protein